MKKTFSTLFWMFGLILIVHQLLGQAPSPLSANGRLRVVNRQLTNEAGTPIQLRGISSHGLHWFGSCYTSSALQTLATDWGADVFRAAMYVDEGGYLNDKAGLRNKVNQLVDWSEQNGMYCIIDWHILNPGNPNIHTADAIDFFRQMAQQHAGKKHVIYEICNEPNGVSWPEIKSYAEQVIPVIRQYDANAIILVGTPNWSGAPWQVVGNPLTGDNATNVMYTFHFYAGNGAHILSDFRANMETALANIPVFASEWGTSHYSGNGGNNYNNAQEWVDFFAGGNNSGIKVSWCNWSFCDKAESSAALNPGACASGNWNNTSESGTWVKGRMLSPADNFGPPTPSVYITSPAMNGTVTIGSSPVIQATVANASATKVEFYNGATKLGEDTSAPYSWTISAISAGTYALTAKAILAVGNPLTSGIVSLTAIEAPPVPPVDPNTELIGPACVLKNDVKVFEVNPSLLPNATNFSWWCTGSTQSITPVAGQPGKATYNFGPSFTGGQVCVGINYSVAPWYKQICNTVTVCSGTPPPVVNQPPTIALTTPANSATYTAPATVLLAANAADSDGSIAKVEFFNGTTKLGEDLSAPYQFSWPGVGTGTYVLTAKATDNQNATVLSGLVTITVKPEIPPVPNVAPTIGLTSPVTSATFTAPATILLTANAADSDGTIAKVEFFNGSTKLGEDLTAPYQFSWPTVGAGTYTLSARATDNQSATAVSGLVTITVKPATPPPTGSDLIGPVCVAKNEVKTYELAAAHLTNATNFSWWVTGSTQSITPVSTGKVAVNFGPWFTGGQVCVGVNYSTAPWHKQICMSVTVCPGARIGVSDAENLVSSGVVFPNPSRESFTFIADKNIREMGIINQLGQPLQSLGSLRKGEQIRFGGELSPGIHLLRIDYEDKTTKALKILKVGK